MKRSITIAFLGAVFCSNPLSAGPVLLARWDIGNSFSAPIVVTSASPVLVFEGSGNDFVFPLFDQLSPPSSFPSNLDSTLTPAHDSDFAGFVHTLTNGINDQLVVLAWGASGPIGGGGRRNRPCSSLFHDWV